MPYKFFTSIYRVSNTGRVKKHKDDDEDLHICQTNGAVWLCNSWGKKQVSIQRLMAICFLDMPDDNDHIAYRKDHTKPYTIDNIDWGTKKEAQSIIAKAKHLERLSNS